MTRRSSTSDGPAPDRLCGEETTLAQIDRIGIAENSRLGKEMALLFGVADTCTTGSEEAARHVQHVYAGPKPYATERIGDVLRPRDIEYRLQAEGPKRFVIGTAAPLSLAAMEAAGVEPYGRGGRAALFEDWLKAKIPSREALVFGNHEVRRVETCDGDTEMQETMKVWSPSSREGVAYEYSRIRKGIGPTGHQDIPSVESWVIEDVVRDLSSYTWTTLSAEDTDAMLTEWIGGFEEAALTLS
jgi:hypothetical protein